MILTLTLHAIEAVRRTVTVVNMGIVFYVGQDHHARNLATFVLAAVLADPCDGAAVVGDGDGSGESVHFRFLSRLGFLMHSF